jgi:hypothetical protein
MLVYRIFCRVTGKNYIGVTSKTLKRRIASHRARALKGTGHGGMYPLSEAIREHGWENFDVFVIARDLDSAELGYEVEKAAIQIYKALTPSGYNTTAGGPGGPGFPDGTRGWTYGSQHTPEARAKMATARAGWKNPRARPFEFKGLRYGCMEDCVKATGLSRNVLYGCLKRGVARYLEPMVEGTYGRPKGSRTSDAARQKMSAARLRNLPSRERPIEVDGVEYRSIISAVGVSGYTRDQLKKKLKRGEARYLTPHPPGLITKD